jgi:hypothetical protein
LSQTFAFVHKVNGVVLIDKLAETRGRAGAESTELGSQFGFDGVLAIKGLL